MWDNLAIFKEKGLFVAREIYIFAEHLHIFLGHEDVSAPSSSWFPSPSQLLDWKFSLWPWHKMSAKKKKHHRKHSNAGCFLKPWLQQLQPFPDSSTHSMLVQNSICFNILYSISISGLCSGVSYQIKLLPTQINLISCAHRLTQCSCCDSWLRGGCFMHTKFDK